MYKLQNGIIFCKDNLEVLRNVNSNSIDLIYLDPPFNKAMKFTAKIGSAAEGASFSNISRQEDIKEEWLETIKKECEDLYIYLTFIKVISNEKYFYLVFIAIRLIEMQRILKETGSIYFHCDPSTSHYIKIVMDIIFGKKNFKNEIVWSYQGGSTPSKNFKKKHDIILFFSKSKDNFFSDLGSREDISAFTKTKYNKEDEKGKYKEIRHSDGKIYRQYQKDKQRITDVWYIPIINTMAKERTGYPTQKPIALLEKIIKASSNEGDIVLDAFCGSGTTCVAAEKLKRQWIGIDMSEKACELTKQRLELL